MTEAEMLAIMTDRVFYVSCITFVSISSFLVFVLFLFVVAYIKEKTDVAVVFMLIFIVFYLCTISYNTGLFFDLIHPEVKAKQEMRCNND